jgi:hypothetical protein
VRKRPLNCEWKSRTEESIELGALVFVLVQPPTVPGVQAGTARIGVSEGTLSLLRRIMVGRR